MPVSVFIPCGIYPNWYDGGRAQWEDDRSRAGALILLMERLGARRERGNEYDVYIHTN